MAWKEFHDLIKAIENEAQQFTTCFDLILVASSPPPLGNPLPHFQKMHQMLKRLEHLGMVVNVSFAASLDEAYSKIKESRLII